MNAKDVKYHFVYLCSNFALANSHARHKRYALECFCGKLLCFL